MWSTGDLSCRVVLATRPKRGGLCGLEGYFGRRSACLEGSRTETFCDKHAKDRMASLINESRACNGCYERPAFRAFGSTRAEFSAAHAVKGMAVVAGSTMCAAPDCYMWPRFAAHGSNENTRFRGKRATDNRELRRFCKDDRVRKHLGGE